MRVTLKKFGYIIIKSSQQSTITTHISKLRVADKPKMQINLEYVDSVKVVRQRNRFFYASINHTVQCTHRKLYSKYLLQCQEGEETVLWGTFNSLKPFYIVSASEKDLQMCVCKKHLHARWATTALLENAKLQRMDTDGVSDYYSLLEYITKFCPAEENTRIAWECAENV